MSSKVDANIGSAVTIEVPSRRIGVLHMSNICPRCPSNLDDNFIVSNSPSSASGSSSRDGAWRIGSSISTSSDAEVMETTSRLVPVDAKVTGEVVGKAPAVCDGGWIGGGTDLDLLGVDRGMEGFLTELRPGGFVGHHDLDQRMR
jgi:hypothetical protein